MVAKPDDATRPRSFALAPLLPCRKQNSQHRGDSHAQARHRQRKALMVQWNILTDHQNKYTALIRDAELLAFDLVTLENLLRNLLPRFSTRVAAAPATNHWRQIQCNNSPGRVAWARPDPRGTRHVRKMRCDGRRYWLVPGCQDSEA